MDLVGHFSKQVRLVLLNLMVSCFEMTSNIFLLAFSFSRGAARAGHQSQVTEIGHRKPRLKVSLYCNQWRMQDENQGGSNNRDVDLYEDLMVI
jgi:hypothetical protein